MPITTEETSVLRDQLAAYIEAPNSTSRANILLELFGGPAEGYVHVNDPGTAEGGQHGAPVVMRLGQFQDGSQVLGMTVYTEERPENVLPVHLPDGVTCKRAPVWQLLRYCMRQNIITLLLDIGSDSLVMIGPIRQDFPLVVAHTGHGVPDRAALEKLLWPPPVQQDGRVPATIVPPGNEMLRRHLAAWLKHETETFARAILHELITSAVSLFVLVKGRLGGEGEPPITPADLHLVIGEGGKETRIVRAATELIPEEINPAYEAEGLFFRQLPAWKLLQFCLHRGIMCIMLDAGMDTGLLISPLCSDRRVGVMHLP